MPPPTPPKPLTDGIPKPKRLRDVPAYLYKRVKGFFSRLFYIVTLVWEASPAILFLLALLCLLDGVLPIGGAYIASRSVSTVSVTCFPGCRSSVISAPGSSRCPDPGTAP